jgi:hypothetical protein
MSKLSVLAYPEISDAHLSKGAYHLISFNFALIKPTLMSIFNLDKLLF